MFNLYHRFIFTSLFELGLEKIGILTIDYSVLFLIGIKLIRPPVEIARYKMNGKKHFRSDKWNRLNALQIYKPHTRLDVDGLNQVNKLNFTLTTKETLLFTFISIDLHRTKEV